MVQPPLGPPGPAQPPPVPARPPLDFGRTFSALFATYKARWHSFIGLGLMVGVVTFVWTTVVTGLWMWWLFALIDRLGPDASVAALGAVGPAVGLLCVALIPVMLAGWWANLAICTVADAALTEQTVTIKEALKLTWHRLLSLIPVVAAIMVVVGLLVWAWMAWLLGSVSRLAATPNNDQAIWQVVGVSLALIPVVLVLSVVAYFLTVKWFVTFPVMVVEQASLVKALGRSWQIVKGASGMVFLMILVVGFAAGMINQIVAVPGSLMMMSVGTINSPASAMAVLGQVIIGLAISLGLVCVVTAVTTPILPILSQVVYRDRARWAPAS